MFLRVKCRSNIKEEGELLPKVPDVVYNREGKLIRLGCYGGDLYMDSGPRRSWKRQVKLGGLLYTNHCMAITS